MSREASFDRLILRANAGTLRTIMSLTVFREGRFKFYFFSREERRMHIHVDSAEGEAKFWIEPRIELARNHRLSQQDLTRIRNLIEEHEDVIRAAWSEHFGS